MSAKRDDGGPAFPCRSEYKPTTDPAEATGVVMVEEHPVGLPGMTLRDWFAGQALAGLLAHSDNDETEATSDTASRWAYEYADAMLAERTKGGDA